MRYAILLANVVYWAKSLFPKHLENILPIILILLIRYHTIKHMEDIWAQTVDCTPFRIDIGGWLVSLWISSPHYKRNDYKGKDFFHLLLWFFTAYQDCLIATSKNSVGAECENQCVILFRECSFLGAPWCL